MELKRYHYRGQLLATGGPGFDQAVKACRENTEEAIRGGKIMAAGIFQYRTMLFAYMECMGGKTEPSDLFAPLSPYLEKWPSLDGPRDWAYMQHVFFFAQPIDADDWKRAEKPERRFGRIARLSPDKKLFEYVYHHVAITREGMLVGDKYQSISLHEDILFSYFEAPITRVNVCRDPANDQSKEIGIWNDAMKNRGPHFIPWEEGGNFLILPALFVLGQEEVREA